jgi:hypothetical protein
VNIISIDPSVRSTGVYWRYHGDELWTTLGFKASAEKSVILATVVNRLSEIIDHHGKFEFGIIEDYAYLRQGSQKGMLSRAEIQGAILFTLARFGVKEVVMPIQTWKSLTLGIKCGKATKDGKEYYISQVFKRYGRFFDSTDTADAFLMAEAFDMIGKMKVTSIKSKTVKKIRGIIDARKLSLFGRTDA